MMFSVVISERAKRDVERIVQFISQDAPDESVRWKEQFHQKATSLESFPLRCGLAPESKHVDEDVRQLLSGDYRILFIADDNGMVTILSVRHVKRHFMPPEELQFPRVETG